MAREKLTIRADQIQVGDLFEVAPGLWERVAWTATGVGLVKVGTDHLARRSYHTMQMNYQATVSREVETKENTP